MISPCKDCTKRQLGCHSTCGDYEQFKVELAEVNKRKRAYHASTQVQIDNGPDRYTRRRK